MATSQQVIAGLYAAFFNRAPDAEGLAYWEGQASGGNDLDTFKVLAAGFATHPKFTDIYSGMTNQQFVEAIYVNALGYEGDSEGISYWTGLIDGDMPRSDMVATFVHSALNIDLNDSQWDSLSTSERETAQNRQDTLSNKADVGIYFAETLGSSTNITNPDDLDNDPAYQASITALADVDNTSESVTAGKALVDADASSEDITIPGITLFSDTSSSDISSSTDKITNEGLLSIGGLVEGGSWIASVNGGEFAAVANGTDSNVLFEVATADGDKAVKVKQVDADGNESDYSTVVNFTLDTTAPTLSSKTPSNSSTDVAVESNIALTFDEAVYGENLLGRYVIITDEDGNTHSTISPLTSGSFSNDRLSVTLNPLDDFSANTTYTVTLEEGTLTDLAGNQIVSSSFSFTTAAEAVDFDGILNTTNADEVALANQWLAATDGAILTIDFDSNDYSGADITLDGFGLDDVLKITRADGRIAGDGTSSVIQQPKYYNWGGSTPEVLARSYINNWSTGNREQWSMLGDWIHYTRYPTKTVQTLKFSSKFTTVTDNPTPINNRGYYSRSYHTKTANTLVISGIASISTGSIVFI